MSRDFRLRSGTSSCTSLQGVWGFELAATPCHSSSRLLLLVVLWMSDITRLEGSTAMADLAWVVMEGPNLPVEVGDVWDPPGPMITTLDRRALRAPELGENRLGLEVPYAATLHDLRRGDALGIGRSDVSSLLLSFSAVLGGSSVSVDRVAWRMVLLVLHRRGGR